MSCEEKNNKRRKKRLLSKQSIDMNSPLHKSVESGKETKKGHTYLDSQVSISQLGNTPKAGTPCIDGERCLLCGKERYDRYQKGELSKSAPCNSPASSLSQAPLWICPDCRRIIEEEERRAAMEISLPDQDVMFQPSLNLTLSISPHSCGQQTKCNHNCSKSSLKEEDTINDAVLDKEKQQLRCCWSELRNVVRCIYREAGTSLADEEETVRSSLDENRLKMKVDKLMNSDPAQLFDKLETQAREYVREVKVRLIKYLTSCPMSPHHAKEFFAMLLDEYQALSKAFDILQPFFRKLDTDHLQEFGLSWDLLHKHLFYIEIYRDHAVYSNLPALITQLRLGAVSRQNYHQDAFPSLLHRYLNFTDDLTEIEFSWKESERALKLYKETQAKLQERKGVLPVEWEVEPSGTDKNKQVQNFSNSLQHRCQCGRCSGSSSPITAPPPFCANGPLSNVSSHNTTSTTENTANHARWTNPAGVSDFNPRMVMCNDLHSIPPSQLLPPPLMTNGLGNPCHCPACSGTNGYREGAKTDQSSNGKMADCQCNKCPYHSGNDQESKSRSLNHPSPAAVYSPPPNNNHIPNNCLHAHHVTSPGTPLHCPLDDPLHHLRGRIIENSIRHLRYDVFHNHLNGHREIDYDENSDSDSNSDDDDEEDDDDDDDVSSSSPRRSSQSSDIDGLGLEVPPGSPSSVRSSGDGSSCDTPPVNQCTSSTSEDGRTERGKYCDCCYCEFFGHAAPPVAPTSHNYTEIRDKLRLRLNKRQPNQSAQDKKVNAPVVDDRSVDDLLSYINDEKGEDESHGSNSKARKRARKKQKKAAEKAEQIQVKNVSTDCIAVNGVHQNGVVEVQRKQEQENGKQMSTTKDCKQKDDKRVSGRKTEGAEKKQVEAALLQEEGPQGPGKLGKKQNHGQDVMRDNPLSCSESRQQCNGKENGCNSWRGGERSTGKKRQDSVSPDPATNRSNVREVLEKSDSGVRVPQKKQGKKKKKASLDDVFLPREDIENDKLTQMDEAERELEEFKRFCMNLTPVERRERIPVNVNLKGLLGGKRNGSS